MKIHTDCEQGSLEWFKLRAGIATASEFKNLLTPGLKPRSWDTEMPNTYLAQKLAEAWTGGPLDIYAPSREAEFGHILEAEARGWASLELGQEIRQVAFVSTDDGRIGCSPDGLIGDHTGIEIKCPEAATHVKYLLAGEVPEQYLPQVYGSMFVTGYDSWKFVSYRRGFPGVILTLERDEKVMAALQEALDEFLERFDEGMKLLEEKNGGPAPRNIFRPPPGFGAVHVESDGRSAPYVFDDNCDVIP